MLYLKINDAGRKRSAAAYTFFRVFFVSAPPYKLMYCNNTDRLVLSQGCPKRPHINYDILFIPWKLGRTHQYNTILIQLLNIQSLMISKNSTSSNSTIRNNFILGTQFDHWVLKFEKLLHTNISSKRVPVLDCENRTN